MPALSLILFVSGCALILCFVFLNNAYQKRLALVDGAVREQIDRKTRAAHEVDANLVQRLCSGKSLGESIDQWQGKRAAILEAGRTKDPLRWTADDLHQWMKDQIKG